MVLGCISAPIRNINTASTNRNTNSSRSSTSPGNTSVKQNQWDDSEYDERMGRGKVYVNMIVSRNAISLDRPYEGEQHATLTIREHPKYGSDVYITIERGQLLDSDFHSGVSVRFDDERAITFRSSRPDDLSSETLFLRGAFAVFVRRLKTAKTLSIEVPVYQAGNQVFEFDVEGFTWKPAVRK